MIPTNSALLIIDVQYAFDGPKWGARNNHNAERNIARILKTWRKVGWPVIHTQHRSNSQESPFHPDNSGFEIKQEVNPRDDEPIFQKQVNSAFIGTNLEAYLRKNDIESLVIVGITTNHCVSTTIRMADNLGFDTYIVEDGTAAFNHEGYDGRQFTAEEIHTVALANLEEEFATIVSTENLIEKVTTDEPV